MITASDVLEVARILTAFLDHVADNPEYGATHQGTIEAVERAVVCRAYYAVFHYALSLASPRGFQEGDHEAHRRLWEWYSHVDRSVGKEGFSLRGSRTLAEYRLGDRWAVDVRAFVQQAIDFTTEIDRVISIKDKIAAQQQLDMGS